jgi:hypothetical protein
VQAIAGGGGQANVGELRRETLLIEAVARFVQHDRNQISDDDHEHQEEQVLTTEVLPVAVVGVRAEDQDKKQCAGIDEYRYPADLSEIPTS